MKITPNERVSAELEKVSEVSQYIWQRQWAERNGGNISVNLTDIIGRITSDLSGFRFVEKEGIPRAAAGGVFYVSGTGERIRDLKDPGKSGCILRIDDSASGYHIIWGGDSKIDFRVTSEFIPHLKIHLDRISEPEFHRAVIHTHPIELVCLSHHPDFHFNEEKFNNAIWQMITEVRFFVPRGVGLIPYTLPGSDELAERTVEVLRKRDIALWSKHGVVASGANAVEVFDLIDVANKGALMYLKCLSCGYEPVGLTAEEMDGLFEGYKP